MMVELHSVLFYTQLLAAFQALSLSLILFAAVSVEFADRTIEVSEGVGQVTVCLLKNSTTAMDFSVTVASVESSPVSAEGLYRESWTESVRFIIISVSLSVLSFPRWC